MAESVKVLDKKSWPPEYGPWRHTMLEENQLQQAGLRALPCEPRCSHIPTQNKETNGGKYTEIKANFVKTEIASPSPFGTPQRSLGAGDSVLDSLVTGARPLLPTVFGKDSVTVALLT